MSEPILLGLLIAPSLAGVSLGIAAAALFLLHQPLKIIVKDRRKGRVYERTRLAERFFLLYALTVVAALAVTTAFAQNSLWILPLLLVLPFAAVQLIFEFRNDGRSLISEVFGALALAFTAPAILLAAQQTLGIAAAVWLLLALRTVPAILYVRARLRLIHGKPTSRAFPFILHVGALVLGSGLVLGGATSGVVLLALSILLVRAAYGLWISKPAAAKTVGFQEVFFGLLYAVVCAFAV